MGWDGFWKSKKDEIIGMLGALDDKIDLNRRMNETHGGHGAGDFQGLVCGFRSGPVRAKAEGQEPYLAQELLDLFPNARR